MLQPLTTVQHTHKDTASQKWHGHEFCYCQMDCVMDTKSFSTNIALTFYVRLYLTSKCFIQVVGTFDVPRPLTDERKIKCRTVMCLLGRSGHPAHFCVFTAFSAFPSCQSAAADHLTWHNQVAIIKTQWYPRNFSCFFCFLFYFTAIVCSYYPITLKIKVILISNTPILVMSHEYID